MAACQVCVCVCVCECVCVRVSVCESEREREREIFQEALRGFGQFGVRPHVTGNLSLFYSPSLPFSLLSPPYSSVIHLISRPPSLHSFTTYCCTLSLHPSVLLHAQNSLHPSQHFSLLRSFFFFLLLLFISSTSLSVCPPFVPQLVYSYGN